MKPKGSLIASLQKPVFVIFIYNPLVKKVFFQNNYFSINAVFQINIQTRGPILMI